MTTTDDDWPDGFASSPPDRPGFWLWMETGDSEPKTLLIVGNENRAEVASDNDLSNALGRELREDENYWESTDVRTMLGRWKFLKGGNQ